jgi:hypothetical protein
LAGVGATAEVGAGDAVVESALEQPQRTKAITKKIDRKMNLILLNYMPPQNIFQLPIIASPALSR